MTNLKDQLIYLADGLREYAVPYFYEEELRDIAERVGTLEWRLEGLEH